MPVINMPLDLLLRLVNRPRPVVTAEEIPDRLHDMGVEVDGLAETQLYACRPCGAVIERTQAQGPPLNCPKCGHDFRAHPDDLSETGTARVLRLDMLGVRPDIFDPGGMGRYMRGFVGVETGLKNYPVAPPVLSVRVDSRLMDEESYRPYIACAVLHDVRFDDERIKLLMNLQEDLHWALGRDRKLASIGAYDLATLRGDNFAYNAVAPDGLRFVPLGWSPDAPDAEATPAEILARHKTGQKYAHLLSGYRAYPMLQDGEGSVLSMPPIINSEATRVTRATRDCFIDVTGLSRRTVDRALNVLVTGLAEVMPEMRIEAVRIDDGGQSRLTPDLTPSEMSLSVDEARDLIGAELTADELTGLLERMGHGVAADGRRLTVRVPAWRNDVMHPVDLVEDAAIAYGYDRLTAGLTATFTVGEPREIEEWSAVARRVLTGLGLHQVMTLTLTSEPAALERWRRPADPRAVRIDNPISVEQTICRVSLLPGLLETFAINKQHDLPQQLFEVGDCCFVDPHVQTGAREERFAAAALIGPHVGYADVRALVDALAYELGAPIIVRPAEPAAHPSFISGRAAVIVDAEGADLGVMGELHPEVLEAYGLRHAVAVMEVSLQRLLGLADRRDA